MGKFLISPDQLWASLGGAQSPVIVDVRRRAIRETDDRTIPGAVWCDHTGAASLAGELSGNRDIVVSCAHGHHLSQGVVAALRASGYPARALRGGLEAWCAAGLPVWHRAGLAELLLTGPSRWVTRRRPKIDRIACPWLILRFIDPRASFLYVEPDQVLDAAKEIGGIAFDIEGAPITHVGENCSFDKLIARSGLADPALADLATIVRGADTARLELAPQSAGLLAMAVGISALAGEDDHLALRMGLVLYDSLYAWRRKAPTETHDWPSAAVA